MEKSLYEGFISGEIWKPVKNLKNIGISDYGRLFNQITKRFLKQHKVKHRYYFYYSGKNYATRKVLLDNFDKKDIKYDYGIPPKTVLINRIKSGNIGVYKTPIKIKGNRPFRYVIQHEYKHYAGYFNTREEARTKWIEKYCELHNLDINEVMKEL